MARGTMHPKKENGRNRNGTPHATKAYKRTGRIHGPEIETATFRDSWGPEVRAWWETWRSAPQAVDFEATDWQRLALLAHFVEAVYNPPAGKAPSSAALSEIRMNEERLGATITDRMRARIVIEPRETPEEDAGATPAARRPRRAV